MMRSTGNRLVQTTSPDYSTELIGFKKTKSRDTVVRRSRIERYLDILRVVARNGPIKQTHIMYKANLSWVELKKNLTHLMKLKMITEIDDSNCLLYAISDTGLSTIYNYEKIEGILTGGSNQIQAGPSWTF
jgi:predicted transcriptional regulator